MKSSVLGLSLVAAAAIMVGGHARAAGEISVTCNGVVLANSIKFSALMSNPITCDLNGGGTATVGADQTNAGPNFFMDGITVIYDTSAVPQLTLNSIDIIVDSFPKWTPPPPPMVPTLLALLGNVQIPDPTGNLVLDLTGDLGGPAQNIHELLTHANCAQCVLNVVNVASQMRDPIAEEELDIASVGRTVYRTDSPIFTGAIPEPPVWTTMILGFFAVGMGLRRRRQPPSPSSLADFG